MITKVLTLFLALGFVRSSLIAQYIRAEFRSSDLVVIGITTASEPGAAGQKWRNDHPENAEPIETINLTVNVIAYIKGSGEQTIHIATPKVGTMMKDDDPPQHFFDGRSAKTCLWFLQRAGVGGRFYEGEKEHDDAVANFWTSPGLSLAPIYFIGIEPSQIQLVDHDFLQNAQFPILSLADLYAKNAAASANQAGFFLQMLADITPAPEKALGFGKNVSEQEVRASSEWLSARFPVAFPANAENRSDALAIRAWWCEPGASHAFVNAYLADPSKLRAPFPAIDDMEDVFRLLPKAPPRLARNIFINLRSYPNEKNRTTRAGIARLGEDHMLDAGILECLAGLWQRPDISPFANGRILDDLSHQIALARRLLD
ncbi:MAG TPA: hypothetical protein VFG65_08455 [Fimbriimonadales bacterium]|jgi:hypothetical protein|nr:hypothetical protein [Fimbriimonadales bacterium]